MNWEPMSLAGCLSEVRRSRQGAEVEGECEEERGVVKNEREKHKTLALLCSALIPLHARMRRVCGVCKDDICA